MRRPNIETLDVRLLATGQIVKLLKVENTFLIMGQDSVLYQSFVENKAVSKWKKLTGKQAYS